MYCQTLPNVQEGDTVIQTVYLKQNPDSLFEYQMTLKTRRPKFGIGLDIGVSYYKYGQSLNKFIGNHGGPSFGINLNGMFLSNTWFVFGFNYKPWTTRSKSELLSSKDTLSENSLFNPVKTELYLGIRALKIKNTEFVVNVGNLKETYNFHQSETIKENVQITGLWGYQVGVSINQVFEQDWGFSRLSFKTNYVAMNYSELDARFENGYLEFSVNFGITLSPKRSYWHIINN